MLRDGVPGLSSADTREYLQFVADQRLVRQQHRLGVQALDQPRSDPRLHGVGERLQQVASRSTMADVDFGPFDATTEHVTV